MARPRIIIAGGGTGGHVFPGLAVADALRALADVEVVFCGTARGIEKDVVPTRGYRLELLDVKPMKGGGATRAIGGALSAARATLASLRLVRAIAPKAVLSVGGYAGGPVTLAAALSRVPITIFEPNGVLGLTNRLLAPLAKRAYVTWPDVAARFELGPLGEDATVTCNAPGCEASDIEVLAGDAGDDPLALCRVEGGSVSLEDGVYSLPPGALVVCPVFVIVLQPASEGASYLLEITPPPPEEVLDEPDGPDQSFQNPLVNREPPPGEAPTATPTEEPTPSPEPTVTLVAGERTPGPATPIPPSTGDSVVVTAHEPGRGPAAALLVVAGVVCGVVALWPLRR